MNHQFSILGQHKENDFKELAVATWTDHQNFWRICIWVHGNDD